MSFFFISNISTENEVLIDPDPSGKHDGASSSKNLATNIATSHEV